jgi:hypothetical protein
MISEIAPNKIVPRPLGMTIYLFIHYQKRGTYGALKRREDWVYVVTEKEDPISTSRIINRFLGIYN